MRPLLLPLALLLAAAPPRAQESDAASASTEYALVGRVVDADTGAPLELATVGAWRVSARAGVAPALVAGATVGADGAFRVEGLTRGRYYAVVRFVGYAEARVDSLRLRPAAPELSLGTVRLTPAPTALDRVTAVAERARVEVQIDRTVYRVADDPLVQGGSTADALETIPSVEVDADGNVSLRGVSNVTVLIDGRPAPVGRQFLGAYLQSLPAAVIEQVEVVPNPSARYEPDGTGGVINLVLKKEAELGVSGALTGGADSQGGGNGSGLLAVGRGPLTLTASASVRRRARDRAGDRFRINRGLDPATQLRQDDLAERDQLSLFGGLNADWRLSAHTRLTAAAQAGRRSRDGDDRTETVFLDPSGTLSFETLQLAADGSDGWNGDLRLGLVHDFEGVSEDGAEPERERRRGRRGQGRRGRGRGDGGATVALGAHALAADVRVSRSGSSGQDEIRDFVLDRLAPTRTQRTADTSDRTRLAAQVDYARPVGGTRVELGYRGELDDEAGTFASETARDGGPFRPDPELADASTLRGLSHAAYVQLARQLGRLGVQAGVRGEVVRSTFTVAQGAFGTDYESLFPSAALAYELGERTVLRASASRRIRRPRERELNPFPSVRDPLSVRVGNPELRPEYTVSAEVGVVRLTPWGSVTLTPYRRHTTGVIRRLQALRADGVTVTTYDNLDTATSSGLEAVVSAQAGAVRGFASLEGYRVVADGETEEEELAQDAWGWGGRLNGTVQLGDRTGLGRTDLQGTLRYRAPMGTEQGRIGARAGFDLALRQRLFGDRASLTVRARDPFGWGAFDAVTDTPTLYQELSREATRQQVAATLTVTFGESAERRLRRAARAPADGGDDDFDD